MWLAIVCKHALAGRGIELGRVIQRPAPTGGDAVMINKSGLSWCIGGLLAAALPVDFASAGIVDPFYTIYIENNSESFRSFSFLGEMVSAFPGPYPENTDTRSFFSDEDADVSGFPRQIAENVTVNVTKSPAEPTPEP